MKRTSNLWELNKLQTSHNIIDYISLGHNTSKNEAEIVRLHFRLQGAYDFKFTQLNASYQLSGLYKSR
ncbi:hypothetical protein [uncultured Cyclobacterium sp.]|uniref:hypothetical protein n=1 Tax=uncultured Cyclobacterium sp. TaxID=453820 RepID=UPI0030EBB6E6